MIVRATCPECGIVDLADAIELRMTGRESGVYSFRCPECRDIVRKPANAALVRVLVMVADVLPYVPPFTSRDVRTFRRALRSDAAIWRELGEEER